MAAGRSFKEFVKDKCYNGLYAAAENYVSDNWESFDLYTRKIHRIGSVEMTDGRIERVYVEDRPGMKVAFDVGFEVDLDIREGDYHYDESEEKSIWIRIPCEGDISCGLDDWTVDEDRIKLYSPERAPANSLSDALVPFIPYDQLDKEATQFLKDNYPEALKITPHGEPPVFVDPQKIAAKLGLTVEMKRIKEDASVFGQLYFSDTEADLYNADLGENVPTHVDGKTILVDPKMFLLRNLGSVNNTIIHECVHWVKHQKVFILEKLFNADASHISCEVVGGAASQVAKSATEQMEKQANQLAPRIQMPAEPFRAKANEYIGKFMRETNAKHTIDVMEQVICALEADFVVSKQAAKIRLVELGFEEAIGTFTYLDDHYVRPHSFRKGALKVNQTFSLSAQDAAIERFVNPELRKLTESGDYLFIDNHYVYNAPLYVQPDEDGNLDLTDYARAHMDECCLIFDMKITSKVGDCSDYHTACFLNREDSDVTFEIHFHNGFENAPQERQVAMRKKQQEEELKIRRQMTDDPLQCIQLIMEWRKVKFTELGDLIDRNPKTLSRIVKGETEPSQDTLLLICFGLKLPPIISNKLLEVFGCQLNPLKNPDDQWIQEALNIKYSDSLRNIRRYLAPYGVEI